MNKTTLLSLLLGLLMASCVNKHTMQSAKKLNYEELLQNEGKWLSQDKTEELILEYEKLASNGDLNAMARLGHLYNPSYALLGGRMPQGYQKGISLNWYKQAADRGHIGAIKEVGRYYEEGIDVEQNSFEAYKWYKIGYQKAPNDFVLKMHQLLKEGTGIEQDNQKAASFLQQAKKSAQKDSKLANELGTSYMKGFNGLTKDSLEASYWLKKALELGDIFSELDLHFLEMRQKSDSLGLRKDKKN